MERSFHRVASKLVAVFGLGSLLAAAAFIGATPAAASSGIGVYVGYADSLRAQATNFPTPWAGSPHTVFEGCTPAATCVYDSGAVRIVNNTGSTVTVNAVAVHVSTCTFSFWAPATLGPGADLIVTQTASGEAPGCVPGQMDTSDMGPGGTSTVGNCPPNFTPDGILPTVDVTINGQTTTYTDSGQVLNPGGIDGACLGNESTQWTVIGHAPCRGSLLSIAPLTQTHGVGSTAAVQATFTNSCGQPLSNVAVQFAVTVGPNAGKTGTGETNASGQATFSYSSAATGTDTVVASVSNLAGTITTNPVTVIWVMFAPGGGAFVIGDLEDISGAQVYWWGAQWWKADHLSSGLAPASFKGYENGNASPWCGQTWTTRPGNSSKPPKTVPGVMAVLVASHIAKNGPVISGDIVKIVLVQTYPGYAANPGHIGRGKIIGTICG